jgi:hypothetical protein
MVDAEVVWRPARRLLDTAPVRRGGAAEPAAAKAELIREDLPAPESPYSAAVCPCRRVH